MSQNHSKTLDIGITDGISKFYKTSCTPDEIAKFVGSN